MNKEVIDMMKRMICLLAAAALVLCGAAMAEGQWYDGVLADPEVAAQFPYHALVELGDGGASALIVSTTEEAFIGDEDAARLYIEADGAAKPVMDVGHSGGEKFYANPDLHTLTYFYRFSGESHIEVYEVKDGALELITTADNYGPLHAPGGDNKEEVSFQDGQPIDEAACEALCDLYANEDQVINYEG